MKQSLSHYLHLTIILCPSPGQDECLRAVIACHETHICTVSQCSSSNHSCKCWPQCCKDNNKSVNMPLIFAFSTFSLPSYLIFVWKETLKYRKSLLAGAHYICHQLLYGPHLSDKKKLKQIELLFIRSFFQFSENKRSRRLDHVLIAFLSKLENCVNEILRVMIC